MPFMPMNTASSVLNKQGDFNVNLHFEKLVQEMGTTVKWSAFNCVNNLNQMEANLFIPIWAGRKLFISSRIS